MLLQTIAPDYGDRLRVNWRYFSLEQVNSQRGPDWKVWQRPDGHTSTSLRAFAAAEAVRQRRPEHFDAFRMALLEARHVDKSDLTDPAVLHAAAERAGVAADLPEDVFAEPLWLEALGRDHLEAVTRWGVFGTPTFVFDGGRAGYVRLMPAPRDRRRAGEVFDLLRAGIAGTPELLEVKRPVPPRGD